MNKEKQVDLLSDFIDTVAFIGCSKCRYERSMSDHMPEETAYADGWRATRNNCYCPKCAKKILKVKK